MIIKNIISFNMQILNIFVISDNFTNDRMTAQIATHPMDVLKIRMQVSRNSLRDTALQTFGTNGFRGFYTGLSAAILRQLTYTTSRLGIYTTLLDIGE